MTDATNGGDILAVVNPTSGRRRYRRVARIAEGLAEGPRRVRLIATRKAGDARRAVEAAPDTTACVVAAGGDGTLREVLQGLNGRDIPIAIVPLGTANIVARAMDIPVDIVASSRLAQSGRCERMDLGLSDRGPFLACAGVGFDAAVVHAFARARRGNTSVGEYVRPVLQALRRYAFPFITVWCDGREVTRRATSIIVGNTPVYGGPATPTPNANPFDGRFDVTLFTARTLPGFLVEMGATCLHAQDVLPGVRTVRARSVACRSEDAVPVQLDGDPAGRLPATFDAAPRAIRLITPHGKGDL